MDELVRSICVEFGVKLLTECKNGNVDQFVKRYFSKSSSSRCTSITAKGTRCSKNCVAASQFCAVHSKVKKDSSSEKKRSKKSDKPCLVHNHGLTSPAVNCDLCEMHGDAFKLPVYEIKEST